MGEWGVRLLANMVELIRKYPWEPEPFINVVRIRNKPYYLMALLEEPYAPLGDPVLLYAAGYTFPSDVFPVLGTVKDCPYTIPWVIKPRKSAVRNNVVILLYSYYIFPVWNKIMAKKGRL